MKHPLSNDTSGFDGFYNDTPFVFLRVKYIDWQRITEEKPTWAYSSSLH